MSFALALAHSFCIFCPHTPPPILPPPLSLFVSFALAFARSFSTFCLFLSFSLRLGTELRQWVPSLQIPILSSMSNLYRSALRGVLQCVAVYCSVLQCAAMCCSVLQCAAVCCSVLQCAAVVPSLQILILFSMSRLALRCVLQCLAVCCSALQCAAVCCSGHIPPNSDLVFYVSLSS